MATLTDTRQSVNVTGNKTLTAADQGIVQNVQATATITLPSTAAGISFTIRNGGALAASVLAGSGANGGATITVAPAAADAIAGNGFTAAINKGAVNTLGNVGDEIQVTASGSAGVTAWNLEYVKGAWTRVP